MKKAIPLIAGVIVFVVGLIVSIWGILVAGRARTSIRWPATSGAVIASDVVQQQDDGGTTYRAEVLYEYTVAGTRYSSDRVFFGDYSSSDAGQARELVNRYPRGRQVLVFYDPAEPEVAALEPGTSWTSYLPLIIGLLVVLAGAALFGVGVFLWRQQPLRLF